jgi:hypothetical protein
LREFLEGVECRLIDQISLLDPALDSASSAHARETLLVLQDFHALAIFHIADAVINGRNLVAQPHLRRRHVRHLKDAMAPSATGRKQENARHHHGNNPASARCAQQSHSK